MRNCLRPVVLAGWLLLVWLPVSQAQTAKTPGVFPAGYTALTTDTARMQLLVKAIADSLNEDQLTHVLAWAGTGLAMATRNKIDTMTGIFNYFIGKAYTYKYMKPDSAIVYYKKVLPFFPDKMRKYHVFSLREIMERYAEMGNKDSSFVYIDSLNALIDTMPESSPRRVSLSQNIATTYQWFGMYKTAIRYYQVAVNGERKNGNKRGLGLALANLGELYSESEDDVKALQYSKEALGYLTDVNMPYIKTASNIAGYYINLGQFDSARVYLDRSLLRSEQIGDSQQLAVIDLYLADIYLGQKQYGLAKPLLQHNIRALTANGDRWNLARAYISFARFDTVARDYAAARDKLLKALAIAKETGQQALVVTALQGLMAVSARINDYRSGFEYQQQYLLQKDSITNERTRASLADLEVSYQTQQKEEQIKLLQQDNAIQHLQIQNNRRLILLYSVVFVTMLVILAVVFYQRNLRHRLQTKTLKAELENKVLRLQMNPHFIFNSLNSIENFIMRNEKRLASDYLNKFARLIRLILDSSRTELVPLVKDMEALQLYVDLEQLRFNNKFSFHTYIDPALLGGDYRAPSLLIQPYVENAIIHGLAHSEENGLQLSVTASLIDDRIRYVIQDNGVGRQQSMEYNRRNKPYHESVGLKITEERIQLFNGPKQEQTAVKITDLYKDQSTPGGTKVEITINAL